MWLLLVACVLLLLLYAVVTRTYKFWERRGVPGPKPLPLIGNIGVSIIGLKNISEIYADIYHKYEGCPFVGVYRIGEPCLMIRDPEIIKNVLIKDFNHFMDNDIVIDKKLDPLIGRNIFGLKGEEWKKSRQFISPHFASGKIKAIFPLIASVSENLVTYLEKQGDLVVDAKDLFAKYSCDGVALSGFGIEGNSFHDPNAQFLNLARKFASPDSLQGLKLALSIFLPRLISIKSSEEESDMSLETSRVLNRRRGQQPGNSQTNNTLNYRKENGVTRNDFLGIISQTPSISPVEIAAHMANFIIDGFESTSTVMTFVLYELSANLECQAKLRKEISSVLKKHDGNFSYEAMQDMVYLDACVSESLRLHPPLAQLSKTCTQRYTMTSSGTDFQNGSVTLESGSAILIPLLGLQRDPKYFSSPDKFIPERFLDKGDLNKYVYMPFGTGPRMCIGNRFGVMQTKIGIAQVIRNFGITLNEKTRQPMKYDAVYFSLYPKGGVWINCKKIPL